MSRQISCVSVEICTTCDRSCDSCCCATNGRSFRKPVQHDWDYFKRLAPFIYGIDRVNLTGGEPTGHEYFVDFVPRFRSLFGCQRLTLSTDGFRVERYRNLIAAHFDEVHFSDYETRPGARAALVQIGVPLSVYQAGHNASNFTPRSHRGSGRPCERGFSETVAFADGKFYPCCVGPGIEGALALEPCIDWRERIVDVPLPCGDCWFSPEETV